MRHEYIEENQIADRYVMGRLDREEAREFEDHYLHCERCQGELELSREMVRGFNAAGAEGVGAAEPAQGQGRRSWSVLAAVAAVVLAALVAAPLFYLYWELRDVSGRLEASRQELREVRQIAQQREQDVEDLRRLLDTLGEEGSSQQAELGNRLSELRQRNQQLARNLRRATSPQVNTPVVPLDALRSASAEPSTVVALEGDSRWVVLSLLLDRVRFDEYRVVLSRDGNEVFSSRGLEANFQDELVLTVNSGILEPGVYQVLVEGLADDGSPQTVGRYAFQVATGVGR